MSSLAIDPSSSRLGVLHPDPGRRGELCELLRELGYGRTVAISDPDAGDEILEAPLDLILLDLDRADPAMLDRIASRHRGVPVIGITTDLNGAGRCYGAHAEVSDFLLDSFEPVELQMRLRSQLGTARLRRMLTDRSARLTDALRDRSAELDTVRETLVVLAAVGDYHDDDSDQHALRVGALSAAVAQSLGLPGPWVEMLGDAAPLHDIGKVGISRRILLKPGSLTPTERLHMMQHVDIGGRILATAQSPVLVLAAEIAQTHHERYDGSGYTVGLAGDQIPLSGRIVAVADVWDTLTHDRPYRSAWDSSRALNEIYDQAGDHFDPRVVEAFSRLDHGALAATGSDSARVA